MSANNTRTRLSGRSGELSLTLAGYGRSAARLGRSVAIARTLGPQGRGLVAAASAELEIVAQLGSAGFPEFTSSEGLRVGRSALRAATATSMSLAVIWLVLSMSGMHRYFDDHFGPLAVGTGAFWIATTGPGLVSRNLLLRLGRRQLVTGAIWSAALLTLIITVILAWSERLTIDQALALAAVPTALPFALWTLTIWHHLRKATTSRDERRRSSVRFVVGGTGSRVLAVLLNRGDVILVAAILGPTEAGLYAIALSVNQAFTELGVGFGMAVIQRGRATDSTRVRGEATRSVLVAAGAAVALAPLIPLVIPSVFGSDFDDSVVPAIILLAGAPFYVGSIVNRQVFMVEGKPYSSMVGQGVGLVLLFVVGPLLLMTPLGIAGMAIASMLAYVIRYVMESVLLSRTQRAGSVAS